MHDELTADAFEVSLGRLIAAYTEVVAGSSNHRAVTRAAVTARQPTAAERLRELVDRHRRLAGGLVVVIVMGALVGALIFGATNRPSSRPRALAFLTGPEFQSGGHVVVQDEAVGTRIDLGQADGFLPFGSDSLTLFQPSGDGSMNAIVRWDGSGRRTAPWSVSGVGAVSPDLHWALEGDAAPLILTDLSDGATRPVAMTVRTTVGPIQTALSGWKDVGPPSWEPDGSRAVETVPLPDQLRLEGSTLVVVRPTATSAEVNDLNPPSQWEGGATWGPSGLIAFIGDNSVDVIRPDGSGFAKLLETVATFGIAWRPDGRQLAVLVVDHVNGPGSSHFALDIVDVTSARVTTVFGQDGDSVLELLGWSPDGSSIGLHVGAEVRWIRADGSVAWTDPLPADAWNVRALP